MAEGLYRLEPCPFATYSNLLRDDGTRVGDMAFHTSAQGTAAMVEMNGLLYQIEEARAEAERLRELLRPIAETFADASASWGCLSAKDDLQLSILPGDTHTLNVGHMRALCAELGIVVKEGTSYE